MLSSWIGSPLYPNHVNLLTAWRLRLAARGWWVTEAELAVHQLLDLAMLGAVLYFADSASNPLASLLPIPLTFAAMRLPGRVTWGLTLGLVGLARRPVKR